MNLERLQTFRVLVETLHFRRTAERLRISQSAVSQQIALLEKEMGAALFERIGRRVYLTDSGRALATETTSVLASIERAHEAVSALSKGDAGRLRVGASTTPGIYLLPQVLGQFRRDMPLVELEFRIANTGRIEQLLLANELDLGVCGARPSHQELFEITLGQDWIVPVLSPSQAGKTRRISAADLARWPLLSREPGSATRAAVDTALARLHVQIRPTFELPSPEALLRAAEAGLGLTFASRRAAAEPIADRHLVELKVDKLEIVRPLLVAYHRDKRVTAAMRELIDLLRTALATSDK